ncbi:hypothetical protein D3C72_2039030 [compost metagenome]
MTASRLAASSVPAPTPVSLRAPAVPVRSTSVPSRSLATVTVFVVASWRTRPDSPLFSACVRFVMSPEFCVTRLSSAVIEDVLDVTRPSMLVMDDVFAVTRPSSPVIADVFAATFWFVV